MLQMTNNCVLAAGRSTIGLGVTVFSRVNDERLGSS